MRLAKKNTWPEGAIRRWAFLDESVADDFVDEHAASLRALGMVPRYGVTCPRSETIASGKSRVYAVYLVDSMAELGNDREAGTRRAATRIAA